MKVFGYSEKLARKSAENAIMIYVDWAGGSYPDSSIYYYSSPENIPGIKPKITKSTTLAELKVLLQRKDAHKITEGIFRASLALNKPRVFIQYIIENGGSRFINSGNESLLSLALANSETLAYLISVGTNVNQANPFGKTPLYYAIQFDRLDAVKLLLLNGAEINHKYKSAQEISGMKCEYNIKHTLRTPLHHAAQHASLGTVKYLLAQK